MEYPQVYRYLKGVSSAMKPMSDKEFETFILVALMRGDIELVDADGKPLFKMNKKFYVEFEYEHIGDNVATIVRVTNTNFPKEMYETLFDVAGLLLHKATSVPKEKSKTEQPDELPFGIDEVDMKKIKKLKIARAREVIQIPNPNVEERALCVIRRRIEILSNQPKLMAKTTELRVAPGNNVGMRGYTHIVLMRQSQYLPFRERSFQDISLKLLIDAPIAEERDGIIPYQSF